VQVQVQVLVHVLGLLSLVQKVLRLVLQVLPEHVMQAQQ
jgi:hypothetical protein